MDEKDLLHRRGDEGQRKVQGHTWAFKEGMDLCGYNNEFSVIRV